MQFQYSGITKEGKKTQGIIDAAGEGEMRMQLRAQGIRPFSVQRRSETKNSFEKFFQENFQTVSHQSVVNFTRQLQVLVGAGIPLVQALDLLSEQTDDKTLKPTLETIRDKVSAGSYFWEALAQFPQTFPKLYISLIRAGEASGAIDIMLKRLTRYLEDSERVRKLLKSSMMYPILVMGIGAGVVLLLMIFVIPKFKDMLESNGQELPAITQFVINLSNNLANNAMYIFVGLGLFFYLTMRYVKSNEGREFLDRITFNIPVLGNIAKIAGIARFSRTMQTLLTSGVNLIDAIDICKATIDNTVLEEAVAKIRVEVENGKTLGSVVLKLGVFPAMAVQMIVVGESTGNLDKMLEKVADYYEAEVEVSAGGLSKLIEPLILVFLGAVVGGLMLAMYMPIFKMAGGAGGG